MHRIPTQPTSVSDPPAPVTPRTRLRDALTTVLMEERPDRCLHRASLLRSLQTTADAQSRPEHRRNLAQQLAAIEILRFMAALHNAGLTVVDLNEYAGLLAATHPAFAPDDGDRDSGDSGEAEARGPPPAG